MSPPPPRPIAFVLAATHQGTLIVNRNDYRLTGRGGYGVGYQLLQTSSFDATEVDFAVQLLGRRRSHFGDGVVALDCGANIGVPVPDYGRPASFGSLELRKTARTEFIGRAIDYEEAALRAVIDRHGYRVFPMGINLLAVHGSDPLAGQIQIRQP